jgi:hypothetical protein
MAGHTPGPWLLVDSPHKREYSHWITAPQRQDLLIAAVLTGHVEQDANAKLIAAAPELLDALKDAVQTARNYYQLFHDETWQARLVKWDAAIAKAEGRE